MYVTGPDVVKTVTQEDVTHEELGGASVHSENPACVMLPQTVKRTRFI